ncbi:hypothetical protein FA95DRAFT_1017813 [Auriscalpium vulgare]|uniref:Uncharacterized protein n=1 Tax=Auriscalpium vulgare TaxID=40419 RepID=A0ACB8RXL0_9AGAM|nr:hypothetical protein FA95DRAFT_1017813 [Auriscalpium vulgare]
MTCSVDHQPDYMHVCDGTTHDLISLSPETHNVSVPTEVETQGKAKRKTPPESCYDSQRLGMGTRVEMVVVVGQDDANSVRDVTNATRTSTPDKTAKAETSRIPCFCKEVECTYRGPFSACELASHHYYKHGNGKRTRKSTPEKTAKTPIPHFCEEVECTSRGPFSSHELTRHNFYMHGKGHQCPRCFSILSQAWSLTRHIRDIHEDPVLFAEHVKRSSNYAQKQAAVKKMGQILVKFPQVAKSVVVEKLRQPEVDEEVESRPPPAKRRRMNKNVGAEDAHPSEPSEIDTTSQVAPPFPSRYDPVRDIEGHWRPRTPI